MSGDVEIRVDGVALRCAAGVPLSLVLSAHAVAWRHSPRLRQARGMYCGMGLCFECVVRVDGAWCRACLVETAEGLCVTTEGADDDG